MNKLRDMDSKIVFLQETPTLGEDNIRIGRRWQGNIYAASFPSQARGVMIQKSVPFQASKVTEYGRYLIIQGSLLSVKLNLVNMVQYTRTEIRDGSTGADQTLNGSRTIIHHFIKELNLLDIVWRCLKSNHLAYSCYSSTFQTYSRIDYFFGISNTGL